MRRRNLAVLPVIGVLTVAALPPPAAASTTQDLQFSVRLKSHGSSLTEMPGGVIYGWNDLRGPTVWRTRAATLRLQENVDLVAGVGPFAGFVTVTRSDGTKLALSLSGYATEPRHGNTAKTKILGSVTVIGGSGPYAKARGAGTFSGHRKTTLDSRVSLNLTLTVETGNSR